MITSNDEAKKEKQSSINEIRETEKYGFQTLKERLPIWINKLKASNSKRRKEQINRTENHTKGLK